MTDIDDAHRYVNSTFYLQLEPVFYGQNVTGAKATRVTQARPIKQASGTTLVKLTVRLPKKAFEPVSAFVTVPDDAAMPLHIDVEDPNPSVED